MYGSKQFKNMFADMKRYIVQFLLAKNETQAAMF